MRATSLTLAAMSLGYAVVQLDVTIVNTALESIGVSLGGGVTGLQWVVSSYTIAFAALILSAGALGDRLGAKRVFMAGFALFTAASLACALAPTASALIAARAVQGVGAAILVPNSLALLRHAYPDERERGRAVGVWAAGASLAFTAGPLAGGGLIAIAGWRSIFLVNLPVGLAGLWLTWRHVGETARSPRRALDLPGQMAAAGLLACLAGAIIEAGPRGWSDAPVLLGFAAAALLAGLFVLRELRAPQPMLPLALFRRRTFAVASAVGLLVNVAFYGLIFLLGLYFQRIGGLSPLATGLAFLPVMGAVLQVNLLAARLAKRFGAPAIIAAGAMIAAAGCAALLRIGRGTGFAAVGAQLLAIGAGLGLLVPPLTAALLGSVAKAHAGIAAGVLNAARQTGSALGVALFGTLAGRTTDGFVAGTRDSLTIAAALFLAAAALIAVGGRRTEAG